MSNYILNCCLERIPLKPNEICVTTGLSVNGRLFIAPREHLDSLVSIQENLALACSRRSDIAGRSEVTQGGGGVGGIEGEGESRECHPHLLPAPRLFFMLIFICAVNLTIGTPGTS